MGLGGYLSHDEAAAALGLTPRAFQHWGKKPGCPREVEGGKWRYRWPELGAWYHQTALQDAIDQRGAKRSDLDEIKAAKAQVDLELAQLELDQARGKLIPVEACVAKVEALCSDLRGGLSRIPSQWAPKLLNLQTIREVQSVLEPALAELLGILANGAATPAPKPKRKRGRPKRSRTRRVKPKKGAEG